MEDVARMELGELVVPIGHHRIAPVDDPGEATVVDEHVARPQVGVDEDAVERPAP
jgi:hypothetical protein